MPGSHYEGFDWTEENGLIRAALVGLMVHNARSDAAKANLVEIVEVIVSEMDADSKLVFRQRVMEPALRGEDPAEFQIRRGPSGRYELALTVSPDSSNGAI